MINEYFAANALSARLMLAAVVCGLLCLIFKALDKWDDRTTARAIARLEAETWQPPVSPAWAMGVLIADGTVPTRRTADGGWEFVPPSTRQISAHEWALAVPGIRRELERNQWD